MAIPFIIFALYVNPILRILKACLHVLWTASRVSYSAVTFLFVISIWALKMLRVIFKNFGFFIQVLWGFLRYLGRNWHRLYVWLKALQSARSKAKAEGIEWKKRHFVVGHFLDKRQKSRNDVEQQQIEEQSSATQSDEGEGDREDRLQDRTGNSGIGRVADPSTTSSREIDKST